MFQVSEGRLSEGDIFVEIWKTKPNKNNKDDSDSNESDC